MQKNLIILVIAVVLIFVGFKFWPPCSDCAPKTAQYKDLIRIETPLPESTITSPLIIRGEARGMWFFEATFPVVLVNWDGLIIAEGYATAKDNPDATDEAGWMTENYVPFEAKLEFTADTTVSNRGALILQKSNPSALPQNNDAFEFTVWFEKT